MAKGEKPQRSKTRIRQRERGASAVEFALVLPLLITLVLGGIEFGLMVQASANASNAAREAVRYASLGRTDAEVKSIAARSVTSVSGKVEVTTKCVRADGKTCVLGADASDATATVVVTIHYRGITGFFGSLTNRDVVGQSTMRIE